jgi:hypothetical protein
MDHAERIEIAKKLLWLDIEKASIDEYSKWYAMRKIVP